MAKNPRLLILPEEKALIYKLWRNHRDENGKLYAKKKLARIFGISPRSVDFIIDPEKLRENKKLGKQKSWKKYYNKDKRREYMRKYRAQQKEENNDRLI